MKTLLLLALSALLAVAVLAHRAPDLGAIKTTVKGAEKAGGEDIASQLEQAVIKQSAQLEFTEGQINHYLATKLRFSQQRRSAWLGKLDRVLVDFEGDLCRLHLCWLVCGHPAVARVDLRLERRAKDFRIEIIGGAYGLLEVPRGALTVLDPALRELALATDAELKALFKTPKIRFTQDKLVVDPRF